jgi:hypothetical protein
MRRTAPVTAAAVVCALLGAIALLAGATDRRLARAQQEFAAEHYDRADEELAPLESYLEYGRWIPWIAEGPLADIQTRRAAIRYWKREYNGVVGDQADPISAIRADNIDLQLIAANAVYRRGVTVAKGQRATLDALQAATSAYLAVLRNIGSAPRTPDTARAGEAAAYNYEYVVRTRDDVDKGRRAPELTENAEDGPAGKKGGPPPQDPAKKDMKLLVPLEPGEMDKGLEPGKGGRIERKG